MFEDSLNHGKIQTASAKLARLLKNYKKPDGERLKPHTVRIGNQTPKGFQRSDFEEAWKRYLPSASEKAATGATSATHDRGNVAAVAAVPPDTGRDGDGSEATTTSGKMVKGYARFLDGETIWYEYPDGKIRTEAELPAAYFKPPDAEDIGLDL